MGTSTNDIESPVTTAHYSKGSQEDNWITVGGKKSRIMSCPFLVNKKKKEDGRCPWPFVFLHAPLQGLQDYQTWIVVGLLLCWFWSLLYYWSGRLSLT